MTDNSHDLAAQRVERALRRFQDSWASSTRDPQALSTELDELDVSVELWLDVHEQATAESEASA